MHKKFYTIIQTDICIFLRGNIGLFCSKIALVKNAGIQNYRKFSEKEEENLQISFNRNSLLRKRVLPLLLVLLLTASMAAIAFGTFTASAADATFPAGTALYFNTTSNTSWNSTATYAVFYDSNGKVVDKKQFGSATSTNLYSVTPSAASASVQLVQLNSTYNQFPPDNAIASGYKRVILNNTKSWAQPYVYAWNGGGGSGNENAQFPGETMTRIGSTSLWYYDTNYEKLIFSNGTTSDQTADLTTPAQDNAVFSGSDWNGNLYSKASQKTDFDVRNTTGSSDANEIYVSSTGKLTMSKFPYSSRTFTGRGTTVYLYNPNWTSAYVTYDFNDPYQCAPVRMTAVSGRPAGFFQATVPSDAHFKFTPGTSTTGSSQETWFMEAGKNCYVINGSNEHWATLDTATDEKADYYATVGSNGNKSSSAYWVKATYFDYLDDQERNAGYGWLNPKWGGTVYNEDSGDARNKVWYPFVQFDKWISGQYAETWANPLYFGNFNNTTTQSFGGTYSERTGELSNFVHLVNNSGSPLPTMNYSVLGIASDKLDDSGNLLYPTISGGTNKMPYFDGDALGSYAKTVSAYFPFNSSTSGDVTTYKFDSASTTDNVSFKYVNGAPTEVNFNSGSAIYDGQADFMFGDQAKVGIFPFNGGIDNPGNGKLDYGFGIKLDMDFRVPEGGKNGSSDVKFTYSGDDDLWVYLSPVDEATGEPDYSKSKLVLDLGGDHKQSEGNINFNTMQSYIKNGVLLSNTSTSTDVTLNASAVSNGDEVWYAYTWSTNSDATWIKASGSNNASLTFSNLKNNVIFVRMNPACGTNPGWDYKWNQTGDLTTQAGGTFTITGWGDSEMPGSWSGGAGSYTDVSGQYFDFAKKTFKNQSMDMTSAWDLDSNGRLNPDKTYHLTVFYMERGLINSNNMMEFSMTPAGNQLQVHKDVDVENVNEALQDDVKDKDSFTFVSSDSTTSKTTALANGQSTQYDKVFKTDSTTTVTETFSSNLSYKTSWTVYDPDTGTAALIPGGGNNSGNAGFTKTATGTARQAKIKLTNPTNSLNMAKLRADYTNTPQTAPLDIQKTIYNEQGTDVETGVSSTFSFTLGIDVNGGTNYQYYDLPYEVGGHSAVMDNGNFSFNSNDTVTISDIPVGATYEIIEHAAAGYTCMNTDSTVSGTIEAGGNTADFQNKITPTSAKITGHKTVSIGATGEKLDYSGRLFTYTLEGMAEMNLPSPYQGKTKTEDTSEVSMTTRNVVDGDFSFNLKFTQPGVYCYLLTEYIPVPEPAANKAHYDSDITYDETIYSVMIRVGGSSGVLTVGAPQYFIPEFPQIQGDVISDGSGAGITYAQFTKTRVTGGATFNNVINPGSVTINKTNQSDENVNNVVFALFKVDDSQTLTRDDIVAQYGKYQRHSPSSIVDVQSTTDGTASFENLSIYKDGFATVGKTGSSANDKRPEYQRYAVAELDPTDGYNLNGEVHYFTLPMWSSDDNDWSYSITYDYVNGKIVNPNASGEGMAIFRTIGLSLLGVSMLTLFGFVGYHGKKRRFASKRARHYKKF